MSNPSPRWVHVAVWVGVAITFAAVPIGLLTPIPSVVISALGLSLAGVGYVAATRHTSAAPTPLDRLQLRLIFVAWLALVIAAAATLLT